MSRRFRRRIGFILVSLCWVSAFVFATPQRAQANDISVLACPTILDALHKDWQATQNLYEHYGPSAEVNPVIRAVGPDTYFLTWIMGIAALCNENRQWQYISILFWLVETWAVNTHQATGTVEGVPLLAIQITFGPPSFPSHDTAPTTNASRGRRLMTKHMQPKWLRG